MNIAHSTYWGRKQSIEISRPENYCVRNRETALPDLMECELIEVEQKEIL